MARQLNVQQQNALTRQGILEAASQISRRPAEMAWLEAVLRAHGLDPHEGMLASLYMNPEQGGHWCRCVWLTGERQFWEIVVVLDRRTHEIVAVEEFEEVTASTPVQQPMPGTGAWFGWLAVQVLEEMRGGALPSASRTGD